MTRSLRAWKDVGDEELRGVRGICLDIDETLSTRGKLTGGAYEALWSLRAAGYAIVPITGRPAGWCDLIARFWPVDAVVGENGAFSFFMRDGRRQRLNSPTAPEEPRVRIQQLEEAILREFPEASWASDQRYREYDLAVDFCEDVPEWPRSEVDRLVALCEAQGAHAKISSIHVNAWFGDYDKFSGFTHLLESVGEPLRLPSLEDWLFIGDSPNDEPLFARFRHSVGVANLRQFADRLQYPPRYLTEGESGFGFEEMAHRMVSLADRRA